MSVSVIGVVLILGLTAVSVVFRVTGARKNLQTAHSLCALLENVFQPLEKTYTNIGGVVGYHISYTLQPPFTLLDGTLTLFPRQALFYYPIARFLGRQDELSFSLKVDFPMVGEAHLVQKDAYRFGRFAIDNFKEMESEEISVKGVPYLLLYYNRIQAGKIADLMRRLSEVNSYEQFSFYGYQRLFYFHVNPSAESLEKQLRNLAEILSSCG
ncbi:MAG: hypothetical protein CSA76_07040, partial [Spirochaetales bacterium]